MTIATSASYVGGSAQYTVPFPYLSKTHVYVYIDGINTTQFDWASDSTITFSNYTIPAYTSEVTIERITPETPLVDFSNGAPESGENLDIAMQQALYLVQEARINIGAALTLGLNNDYNAAGRGLVGLTTDTTDLTAAVNIETAIAIAEDAATDVMDALDDAVALASTHADDAESAKDTAVFARDDSYQYAVSSQAFRDEAETLRDGAYTAQLVSQQNATDTLVFMDRAEEAAVQAENIFTDLIGSHEDLKTAPDFMRVVRNEADPALNGLWLDYDGHMLKDAMDGADGEQGDTGDTGTGVNVKGSVVNAGGLPGSYTGDIGDMYIAQDTGNGHVWDGASWVDVGQIRGPQGEQGPAGAQGIQGAQGPQGPAGADGMDGAAGATGATGPTGPQGPTGATGPQGPQGEQGIQGEKGDTGTGVTIIGSVASAASLPGGYTGDPGDMYITQDDGHGHVWNGATWDDVGQIQGPTGATGPQGPQGIQGIQGPAGADGADGATGPQGDTGPQGPTGATGATGPQGLQGEKGDTGDTGPQGIQGPTGPQGIQGIQGEQGPAGADGTDGTDGADGADGVQAWYGTATEYNALTTGQKNDTGFIRFVEVGT